MKNKRSPTVAAAKEMDFAEAMRAVLDGKKVARASWQNEDAVFLASDGYLMIRRDMALHQFVVGVDAAATDWFVVREQ